MAVVPTSLELYTPSISDYIVEVLNNTTQGVTRTLTQRAVGQNVTVKDGTGNAGTNNITIVDNLGALIDGASSYVISSNWDVVNLYWNGSSWRVK